ncbi:YkvA family protein [Pelomonas sp. KK5]|uniref:YkvA family protein n=1 Tax=Pelomonas sp. KK5 TaxID=1855730 RepID=UPI00097BD139|nr:YkvA family protein [Pelomonas sp. KK5]
MCSQPLKTRLLAWARRLKRDGVALWFAARDRRTPWAVRALCAIVVGYALSPIDLIPDFIPVLGFVDDALLLPALIWLAIRLMPPALMAECRERAEAWLQAGGAKPKSRAGAAAIVALWLAALGGFAWWWAASY